MLALDIIIAVLFFLIFVRDLKRYEDSRGWFKRFWAFAVFCDVTLVIWNIYDAVKEISK